MATSKRRLGGRAEMSSGPRASGSAARERILSTAYTLFSQHGIRAVGVDTIIEQSGVAKMTVYRHFRSKDDLVLAVLERREELWTRGWLQADVRRRAEDPGERLLAIFDVFDGWFRRRSFEGCLFVNALLEIDDRKHPIHQASREQLARIRSFIAELASEAGVAEPDAFAAPVAHPDEGIDRRRGRGRRRRRAPGPGDRPVAAGQRRPGPGTGCCRPRAIRRRHDGRRVEGRQEPGRSDRRPRRRAHAALQHRGHTRELDKVPPLDDLLSPGTPVFITWLSNVGFGGTVTAARRVAEAGLVPVPHLAARAVRSVQEIDDLVGTMVEQAGIRRVLVIAGSVDTPAGPFPATIDLLRTGVLERHGISWVGVAGHPEGSPDVGDADLVQAIVDKNAFASETGLDVHLVTQFCFTPEPVVIWERSLREAGNRLPVHVGLPGAATAATLLRFGLRCGVGPSVAVMRKRAGSVLKLATAKPQYPEGVVGGVAAAAGPETCFEAFHFFPFGALERTAAWARSLQAGRFTMPSVDRIVVRD